MPCPLPRRTRTGAHVGCFPVPRGLPRITGGSASATSLSRPAQASLELRPVGSLNRPRRPLSQGFDPSSYPDKPPASYQIKPTTVWVVPSSTSDTRLLGAPWITRLGRPARTRRWANDGSHRAPRPAWCHGRRRPRNDVQPCIILGTTNSEVRLRLRLDVELPPMAPELLGCRLDHCQSPLLAIVKSAPEVRALCSAGITRPHSSYGPVRRPRRPSPKVTLRARPSSPPGLPRLPVSLFQRRVPSTPADQDGCTCRLLPRPARPSPDQAGRHPRLHFRGLLRLHSNYGPLDRSPKAAFVTGLRSIRPDKPPASYQIKPTTVWVVPSSTSDTRLLGAP